MDSLDLRRVRVSLEINGQLKSYDEGLHILSTGCKFASPQPNEAEVQIANLSKADRDYLLTECSPFNKNRTRKKIILEAGRVSTGLAQIYIGDITTCIPTQPPDILLKFKCQTGAFLKGNIVARSGGASVPLSQIAGGVASDLGVSLDFQAPDKLISNFSFTGGAGKQVDALGCSGGCNAFVDDEALIIKAAGVPLAGQVRILSADSGLVGIPEVTEHGVRLTYMLDNTTKLGGGLQLVSTLYPALSGLYSIYKLGWNISSREGPFYWVADCLRRSESGGVVRRNPVPKHGTKKK